jgi:lipopolysaccharide/colanic/teichoic acid biosynthesis glycosyltransferase
VRRFLNAAAAAAGLVLLTPVLGVLALVVFLGSGRPVFFRTLRIGRNGRPFVLYKFRTMVPGADSAGPSITAAGDPRITAVGRWLRRTKLDELPQLWNVLKGDMDFVGPRPEAPEWVAKYTDSQRELLRVRPGVTGLASLTYRDEESQLTGAGWEEHYLHVILPAKIRLELEYVSRRTLLTDVHVMIRTLLTLFRRRSSDSDPGDRSSSGQERA